MAARTGGRRSGGAPAGRSFTSLLVGILILGLMAGPGRAQAPMQSFGDMPARPRIDPDVDPYPFDPFLSLRIYLRQRLPAGWWARDPVYDAGAFTVVVNIPENWRGNPTSAMLQLCPQPTSALWQGITLIELKPFFHKSPWPSVSCRK